MKNNFKNVLFVIVMVTIAGFISYGKFDDMGSPMFWLFPAVILIVALFAFVFRGNASFKPFFTSKFYFLNSKYNSSISSNLSKELMFEKMVEVVRESNLNLRNVNVEKMEILATSGATWKTWGENIYIDFEEKGKETVMHFCSTTIIGMIAWGQNEQHYNSLLSQFEDSLTI